MEATDLVEHLRDAIEDSDFNAFPTRAGFDEAAFFIDADEGGTFIVTVAKVAE